MACWLVAPRQLVVILCLSQALRQCFDFYMSVRSSSPTATAGDFTIPTLEVGGMRNTVQAVHHSMLYYTTPYRMLDESKEAEEAKASTVF